MIQTPPFVRSPGVPCLWPADGSVDFHLRRLSQGTVGPAKCGSNGPVVTLPLGAPAVVECEAECEAWVLTLRNAAAPQPRGWGGARARQLAARPCLLKRL